MLILTKTHLAGIADGQVETVLDESGLLAAAATQGLAVAATEDGRLIATTGPLADGIETGIDEPITSLLVRSADPLEVFIGTEGAHLHHLADGTTRRVRAFDELSCRDEWHTPWGGPPAVRTLTASADGYVYADIHVGSIMRSADGGQSWEPVTPSLHQDVHQVATSPAAASRVVANTAAAVYVSDDHGQSWDHRGSDLDDRYGRAVAVHPHRPDVMLATVSDGPHGEDVHGQLYRTTSAGRSWEHVVDGFPPSTPKNINTGLLAFTADGRAWAATDTRLFVSEDAGASWQQHWQGKGEILQLASPV